MNQQKELLLEDIANGIWEHIDFDPDDTVYKLTLTWEDIICVLAKKMSDYGIPANAFTTQEIERLLERSGRDITLPWQETIDLLLDRDWPEPCRFDRFDPNGRGEDIFYTTTLFWTCECAQNDIHPREYYRCPICGHYANESPGADVAEVFAHANELPEDLMAYLREQWDAFLSE